jgi:hypothetical protein
MYSPFIVLNAFDVRTLLAHPPGCGAFDLHNRGSSLRAPTPGYLLSSLRDGLTWVIELKPLTGGSGARQ